METQKCIQIQSALDANIMSTLASIIWAITALTEKGEAMKITLKETTIEADAKDLRESRTLADCLTVLFRNVILKSATPESDEVEETVGVNDEAD